MQPQRQLQQQPQPQPQQINLMEYYHDFTPFRKEHPGAEKICAFVEEKIFLLLQQVSLMVVPIGEAKN